jgi:dGTPase
MQPASSGSSPFRIQSSVDWKAREKELLAPYAAFSDGPMSARSRGEREHPYRSAFQRDRDRIIHSHAFRRLKHKRQVFLITYGDHFRTRLTHTLEVSQIARTMARALRLNEDLAEAIALGHDLGHTPFGHLGEVVLDEILQGRDTLDGALPPNNLGGFKHNYQSLRVVDCLEQKYESPGLNLTAATREGILKHTRLKRNHYRYPDIDMSPLHFDADAATTAEGQIVAIADEVAQRTHDLEDGMRAALVKVDDVRQLEIVKIVERQLGLDKYLPGRPELFVLRLINGLIEFLVTDIIEETLRRLEESFAPGQPAEFQTTEIVGFGKDVDRLQKALNKFIYDQIIYKPSVRVSDGTASELLRGLFRAYVCHPDGGRPMDLARHMSVHSDADDPRRLADFIAGMTDNYAIAEARRLQKLGVFSKELDMQVLFPSSTMQAL